jgi:hypothetical protein
MDGQDKEETGIWLMSKTNNQDMPHFSLINSPAFQQRIKDAIRQSFSPSYFNGSYRIRLAGRYQGGIHMTYTTPQSSHRSLSHSVQGLGRDCGWMYLVNQVLLWLATLVLGLLDPNDQTSLVTPAFVRSKVLFPCTISF